MRKTEVPAVASDIAPTAPDLTEVLRQQESLREVIEAISSELELRPLLTKIVREACALLGADRGAIGLVDEARGVVRTAATYRMPENEIGAEMPPGVGVAGEVYRLQKPIILGHYGELDKPLHASMSQDAVVGVPIFFRSKMIGVFGLGAAPPRQFHGEDAETLALLARHAAIAISNAQAFEAEKQQVVRLQAVSRIGQLLTGSLSQDEILQTAVTALNEHLGYAHVALLLRDPSDLETLVLKASSGLYTKDVPINYRRSVHQGVIGQAARSKKSCLVADVVQAQHYLPLPGGGNIRSELAVPILVGDEVVGVLNIESETLLSQQDVDSLSIIAAQLVTAVDNARLFARETRRATRTATMGRVGQLVTSSLSLEEILQTTVEAINDFVGYSSTGIFLLDDRDARKLVLRARSGWETGIAIGEYTQQFGEGNVGRCAQQRRTLFIPNVSNDPHYISFGNPRLRSELALPILFGERLLGVLNVESETAISEDDVTGLEIIVDQLGVAIDNARLFTETEQALGEMQLLYETSRRMNQALNIEGVVEAYLEQVATQRRYSCSVVLFSNNEAGEREEMTILGRWRPPEGLSHPYSRHRYFEDAFDAELDAGHTVTMSDATTDPRASEVLRKSQKAMPALALIPLLVRDERIGVVSLSYPQVHPWSEADLRPYQVTAAQLATALYSRQQQQRLLEQEQRMMLFNERQRLSRDLHDSVTQLIFSMTLIAQSIGPTMKRDPDKGEERVGKLLELAQKARAEMRTLLGELRGPASAPDLSDAAKLRSEGLARALADHVASLGTGVPKIHLDPDSYQPQASQLEEALFRITQEALNNTLKHAGASCIDIRLKVEGNYCYLDIVDDGSGFDVSAGKEGHFGLRTMRERAEILGGTFTLHSSPTRGTKIAVKLVASPTPQAHEAT